MSLFAVTAASGSYEVEIERGLLRRAGRDLGRGRTLVIADEHTAPLAGPLSDLPGATLFVLPAGEASKQLSGVESACSAAARAGIDRDGRIVAFGGGVVGDLAGVVAANYLRGVDLVHYPTTLLAMVDSSIGGKAAVNLPEGKNLVGAFKPPVAVRVDPDLLASLPPREFRSGLAEIAKYSMISDRRLRETLVSHQAELLQGDLDLLTSIIETCCGIKAGVVSRDENERGERAILNYGHTFGHALETVAGYGRLTHGEAISVGMEVAGQVGQAMGITPAGVLASQADLLDHLGLPRQAPGVGAPEDLLVAMRRDKKSVAGETRWVLLEEVGCATFGHRVPDAVVLKAIERALEVQD